MQHDKQISAIRQFIIIILHNFIVHARNCYISTSGLKCDITVMFLHPNFLKDMKISAVCIHLRQLSYKVINICMNFQTS